MKVSELNNKVDQVTRMLTDITCRDEFSAEERDEAADACAMMASSDAEDHPGVRAFYVPDAIDHESRPAHLARAALWSIKNIEDYAEREIWAEAEAMIRCGWAP